MQYKWASNKDRRIFHVVNYFNKICSADNSRLISKIYKWDKKSNKSFTWSWEVQQILVKLKFENEFNNLLPIKLNLVKEQIQAKNKSK